MYIYIYIHAPTSYTLPPRAVNMFLSHGHSFADASVCGIQKTLHQTEPRKTYISRGMILLYLYIHVGIIWCYVRTAEGGGAFRRRWIFFFLSSSSLFGSSYGVNGFFNHRHRPKFHRVCAFSATARSPARPKTTRLWPGPYEARGVSLGPPDRLSSPSQPCRSLRAAVHSVFTRVYNV